MAAVPITHDRDRVIGCDVRETRQHDVAEVLHSYVIIYAPLLVVKVAALAYVPLLVVEVAVRGR